MAYRRKPKKPTIKQLRKQAPKVPDLTCPMIDDAINKVESSFNIGSKKYTMSKKEVAKFKKVMEEIREANDKLRESGRFWYEQMRDLVEPDNVERYD